jgi:hypothetical protein
MFLPRSSGTRHRFAKTAHFGQLKRPAEQWAADSSNSFLSKQFWGGITDERHFPGIDWRPPLIRDKIEFGSSAG